MADGAMASAPRRRGTHGSITAVTIGRRNMMNKVWLVWQGEYSAKDVVAVAQTEVIAKKIAEIYSLGIYKPKTYVTEANFASYENYRFDKAFYVERNSTETKIIEVSTVKYVDDWNEFDLVNECGYDLEVWVKANDPEEAISKADVLFDAYEKSKGG